MEPNKETDQPISANVLQWYAMRATYRREIIVRNLLAEQGIETFIPMKYTLTLRRGRKRRELVPAIHNLIFVHASPETMKDIKSKISYLQYMMDRKDAKEKTPIIIPEKQMEDFIKVASMYDQPLEFIPADRSRLIKGTRVRIHGKQFGEVEGVLTRTPGSKAKKIIVAISGIISVVTSAIEPERIEIIEQTQKA